MSLAKNIKWEMHIKMMYNIATFKNVFQYQIAKFNNVKPQLLLHQPYTLLSDFPSPNPIPREATFCQTDALGDIVLLSQLAVSE